MSMVHVTEDHRKLADAMGRALRETLPPSDAIVALSVCVAFIALSTANPADVVDFAIMSIAQLVSDRGPIAKAVLDVIAEQMEPSGV